MARKARVEVPDDKVAQVLFLSDRTCCVCREPGKSVQIHHVDGNRSNNELENLAVLCLECHNKTLVSGGFGRKLNTDQVILYRDDWYNTVRLKRASAAGMYAPLEPEMLLVPGGEFKMGSDPKRDKLALEDELPLHSVYLPDYCMSRTPINNEQYAVFVQALDYRPPNDWQGGHPPSGKRKHPVTYVSWNDAMVYCDWLSEITDRNYALPSEAEWEKAARGSDARIYPWGDQWEPGRCNAREGGQGSISPVGTYPDGAGPHDLLDMAGNVREWTVSTLRDYPYDRTDGREELIVAAQAVRVIRGGAYNSERFDVRCARRGGASPDTVSYKLGFRVVRRT